MHDHRDRAESDQFGGRAGDMGGRAGDMAGRAGRAGRTGGLRAQRRGASDEARRSPTPGSP
jgi:hypothetical protein